MDNDRTQIINEYLLKAQMLGMDAHLYDSTRAIYAPQVGDPNNDSIGIFGCNNGCYIERTSARVRILQPSAYIDTHPEYHAEIFEIFLFESAKRKSTSTI